MNSKVMMLRVPLKNTIFLINNNAKSDEFEHVLGSKTYEKIQMLFLPLSNQNYIAVGAPNSTAE